MSVRGMFTIMNVSGNIMEEKQILYSEVYDGKISNDLLHETDGK